MRAIDLGHGITCLDADYMHDGLACLYVVAQGDELAVIETGTSHSAALLLQWLQASGYRPEQVRYVIPTHVHLDHAGGAGTLMQACPDAYLLVHPRGARHMIDPAKLIAGSVAVYGQEAFTELYGEVSPVDRRRVIEVADGAVYHLDDRPLEFRHTPGHADHHFCVWDTRSGGWFSGDVMGVSYPALRFESGDFVIPTTTPVQFRPDELLASIEMLASYQPDCFYLTHFSRLSHSAECTRLLSRQIRRYCNIARQHASESDRTAAIIEGLREYTREELAAADAPADVDFDTLLQFDLALNAQGLDVWLSREIDSIS